MSLIDYPLHADQHDRDLIDRAGQLIDGLKSPPLNGQDMRRLVEEYGTELATALLYVAVRRANSRVVTAAEGKSPWTAVDPVQIVLMPGAFHAQHEGTGAKGQVVSTAATALGWPPIQTVPLSGLGSLETNAKSLVSHLSGCRSDRVMLVSLSKGSADVAWAFGRYLSDSAFKPVMSWVSLSGIVLGTPLINWFRQRPLRWWAIHAMVWSKRLRFSPIEELSYGTDSKLAHAPKLPSNLSAIHVIGFPLWRHLRHKWAFNAYQRLLPEGPNDGGGIMLADVLRLPGEIYPAWGADHYLNPSWDFSELLPNILLHAARSATTASMMPDGKSTA